ncbi:MAG: hypothetical protein KJ556_20890, partial [Gammaproteobacteria bacterium]|nr:hypothetical protein [Gammaproteobacteria bacterium]
PWAINCRLEDSITSRLRGGSFTGIAAGTKSDPVYRDRAVVLDGAIIQVSRVGDHDDFDFSKDVSDTLRATLFSLAEGGETPSSVVTVVPHKDSHLLCFTATKTWILSGDPTGGTLRNVSREVGIIAENAWCVNHDMVYFLSSRGLYSIGADGSGLKPISEDKIPEHLIDISDDDCVLDYNHSDGGVYIHLTSSPSWFYDTERDQFWPFDTTESASHLLIGPLRIGGPNHHGLLQTITAIMAQGSGTVTWRIVGATTAEEVAANGKLAITASIAGSDFDQYVDAEGSCEAGRSNTQYPRVRSPWIVLWLSSTETWAYESIVLEIVPWGRVRV